jgi:shikimate dehydrogenase
MINAKTTLCCIIGNPVNHSLSPQLHNAAYEALGLNFAFLAFTVEDVKHALSGFRALGIRGTAVTIPHKLEVMKYVDEIDETAKSIGAANTIVNDNGKLTAMNTDWHGALAALEEVTTVEEKTIALIGAGGAARAIAYGLKRKGAIVRIFNRTKEKGEILVKDFDLAGAFTLNQSDLISQSDIIINTTSVGMHPNDSESPISRDDIESHHVVFDIVYAPRETMLLKAAKEKGATIVYGDRMLLHGVMSQFELFTGEKAPSDIMEAVLQTYLQK